MPHLTFCIAHHSSIVDERVAVLEFSMLCTSQTVFFSSMFPKPNLNINDVCSCIFTPALPAENNPHCKINIPTQRHLPILSCKNMVLPTWFTLEKCCVLIVQSNLLKCFWNLKYCSNWICNWEMYIIIVRPQIVFCKSKTRNSKYLGPKTVMNMRTDRGKDSGTVLRYYVNQPLSTGTNSSFH